MIGRLTKDPILRQVGDTHVCTFTIAVDRPSGKDKVDFPQIKVWAKSAENCAKYLKKGSMAGVTGEIETGSYEDKESNKVYTNEIRADRVKFLSTNSSDTNNDEEKSEEQNDFNGFQAIDGDSDIPF
jgi:single-strand DNA-binding protein